MDSIVNFELAKQLKEHGFDKGCNFVYHYPCYDVDGNRLEDSYIGDVGFVVSQAEIIEDFNFDSRYTGKGFCSAPTIAQVVMWIYEIRGIWIEARINISNNTFTSFVDEFELDNFNTPTEAYIDAIVYILN